MAGQRNALLVLDMENEIVHPDGKFAAFGFAAQVEKRNVIPNTKKLIAAARAAGVPVIYVHVAFEADYSDLIPKVPLFSGLPQAGALIEGTWGTEIHDELKPQPGDLVVRKRQVNPFIGTPLDQYLRKLGAERVILAGCATNFVVEASCRHAADLGFEVAIASDCCSSLSDEAHDFTITNILPMLSNQIAPAEEIIESLK
ncbi:MAG: cysteine hydrolase [Chloroflexi bacterium]|nr:cysteine hydrolase [Chloroflexota bacterium]